MNRQLPLPAVVCFLLGALCSPNSVAFQADQYGRMPDPRATLSSQKAQTIIRKVQTGKSLLPASWPNGKRVAVALTFDLDAELVWMRNPERATPATLSRGSYGPRIGLTRILNLLDRRQLPATFFFPALILQLHPDAITSLRRSERHAIGFHGYGHEDITTLSEEEERQAMSRGIQLFKDAGIAPRVYRSPAWNFSPSTLKLLQEFGFRYDSSLMGDDRPYEILAEGVSTGIIELPVDWSLDDWPYFQLEWSVPALALRNPDDVLQIWKEEFEGIRSEGSVFILTMHPQVIGRWSRMRMLERLLDHIDSHGDAWYATLEQVGEHLDRKR